MNKKEINEIRKAINDENGLTEISRVLTTYVDAEKNIVYSNLESGYVMDTETLSLITNNFRKMLKGKMGKTLIEFDKFNKSAHYDIFTNVLDAKLDSEEFNYEYIQHIIDNNALVGPVVIFTAFIKYSIISKHSDDTDNEYSEDSYNFIVASICPVCVEFNGLICTDEPKVEKELTLTKVVQDPVEGFIFPAFCDRCADLNSILYSCATIKSLDKTFISNCLDCVYDRDAEQQKETFIDIIEDSIGNNLTFNDVYNINKGVISVIEQNVYNTEPTTISKDDIVNIMENVGFDDEIIENITKVCDVKLENEVFNANAIVNTKHTIETDNSVKITYNDADNDNITIKEENGRKYIIIAADEISVDNFTVNN